MKKLICFLMVGAASVYAVEFFGIGLAALPKDDISGIVQGLIDGDRGSAAEHLEHLASTSPGLAREIKLSDLEVPCADCSIDKSRNCKVCGGKLLWINPEALRYLQVAFKTSIDDGEPVEKAWAFAKQGFDERKALILSRKPFKGTVFQIDANGVLIKGAAGKIFFLADEDLRGMETGKPLEGYRWLIKELSHSYQNEDGTFQSVPFYTHNLWWDY